MSMLTQCLYNVDVDDQHVDVDVDDQHVDVDAVYTKKKRSSHRR